MKFRKKLIKKKKPRVIISHLVLLPLLLTWFHCLPVTLVETGGVCLLLWLHILRFCVSLFSTLYMKCKKKIFWKYDFSTCSIFSLGFFTHKRFWSHLTVVIVVNSSTLSFSSVASLSPSLICLCLVCVCGCVCVGSCVCVWEGERERVCVYWKRGCSKIS